LSINNVKLIERKKFALDKILDWLIDNLEQFDISLESYEEYKRLKAFSELCFFIGLYRRTGNSNTDMRIKKIVSFVIATLQKSYYHDRLLRAPALVTSHAGIAYTLSLYGIDLPNYRDLIQSVIDQQYASSKERIPYRVLDLRYNLDKMNITHSLPQIRSVYMTTLLHKNPPIIPLNEDDVYAITHPIFYLTDFGLTPSQIPLNDLPAIKWTLHMLLGIFLRARNWDILGELLMCAYCLQYFPSTLYEVSWDAILDSQDSRGFIPGPNQSPMTDAEKISAAQIFFDNYHTALVIAMACSFPTSRNLASPRHSINLLDSSHKTKFSSEEIERFLNASNQWLRAINLKNIKNAVPLLQILVGRWAYGKCLGDTRLREDLANFRNELTNVDGCEKELNKNVQLSLLATWITRQANLRIEPLEYFAELVYDALKKSHFSDLAFGEKSRIIMANYQLKALGFPVVDDPELKQNFDPRISIKEIYENNCITADIADYLATLTMFGHRKLDATSITISHVINALPAMSTFSLRSYNLELGLRLLRTMNYLNLSNTESFHQAVRFLLHHQQSDGRIGFFAPEISRLGSAYDSESIVSNLFIPITMSAIWTFSEILRKDFRLLSAN
jgi:hypothetical protein